MKKVERLEKELLKVLTKKYCQYEINGKKFSSGEILTEVKNDEVYIFLKEGEALYEIVNGLDIELNEYEKLDSILMNICNKYNYDYDVPDDYTICFYNLLIY